MFFARNYGYYIHMTANDLKLITGILIIVCLMLSRAGYSKGGRSGWGVSAKAKKAAGGVK
jgi:putative ABC transport system permease protein